MKKNIKSFLFTQFLLIPVITLLLSGVSCKKSPTYMVPDNFKRYFDFPVGSYWVYKNQSGALDTVILQSQTSDIRCFGVDKCYEYQEMVNSYKSSRVGLLKLATFKYTYYFMLCERYSPHYYFTELSDFVTNDKGEQTTMCCDSDIEWWIEDTVVVNNKNYFDVVVNKTISFIQPEIADYPVKGYFKEDIGLLKRELQNGEIWELVDYRINNGKFVTGKLIIVK
jgi:hypothetical protein